MKKGLLVFLLISCLAFVVFAGGESEGGDSGSAVDSEQVDENGFKRSETLYVTGGMWQTPSNFNPINWSVIAGVRGLVYESLFYYDPITNEMNPWLAESYAWINGGNTLEVKMREGVTFNNGDPLTIDDIAFSFSYASWSNPWNASEVNIVDDSTVHVVFDEPNYHSLELQLYIWPVIKKSVWEEIPPDAATDTSITQEQTIGTGPYTIESFQQDRVIYVRNENWWGQDVKGVAFPAKRIVYFKSMANNVVMGLIDNGTLDMANNFIPGLPEAKKQNDNIHTWFDGAPYHYADNVVYLMPNCQIEPYSDPAFRRAMAFAINQEEIVDIAFEDMVTPPENSLGLLSTKAWAPYNNKDIADNYGFSYNPEEAMALLDAAGYTDQDGDGFRDFPDGSPLEVEVSVPMGWTDFMDATRVIADNFAAIGLNSTPKFPDEGRYQTDMVKGEFQVLLNNWGGYQSHSPFTMYQWLFSTFTPVGEDDWTGNFGRYDNPEMRELVQAFGSVPVTDPEAANEIAREIQMIHMEDMPYIPLWINGMWFAANDSVWTNWPGESNSNKNYPSLWADKLQIGGLLMLSEVELRK